MPNGLPRSTLPLLTLLLGPWSSGLAASGPASSLVNATFTPGAVIVSNRASVADFAASLRDAASAAGGSCRQSEFVAWPQAGDQLQVHFRSGMQTLGFRYDLLDHSEGPDGSVNAFRLTGSGQTLAGLWMESGGQAILGWCALKVGQAALPTGTAEQQFAALDLTQDGWLSGTELTGCNCTQSDTNHDGEVSRAEFLAGRQRAASVGAPAAPATRPATASAPAAAPPQPTAAANPACGAYHFSGQPVTRESFFSLWSTISPQAAICLIQARGVAFQLTAEDERRVNTGFTYPEVVAALRANYRAPAPVRFDASHITPGHYTCHGVVTAGTLGALRPELTILDARRYLSDKTPGASSYQASTRTLTFQSGGLAGHGWVGMYIPDGFPDETGSRMDGDTIVIRDLKDVQAGNNHDLQWCKRASR
ncbi:hypothetical protein [Deinococcus sonorensis]|uniref:EF-hand domain-containing protein n=2 Tax=Deinococcus sonorensis TaxID=309891 RepID=A0AAU7UCZ7_9DEIO